MPQLINSNSIFTSPSKNLKGLKALLSNNVEPSNTDDVFNENELAQRKAEEAASRRYQAAEWLRQMDQGASETLPKEPSEEEFCLALRNGLILCNVLNKVNPGAVLKIVENPIIPDQSTEGAAQSAIQYFENMRNFLVAVKDMQLLTFEASDVEKGGSMTKVVDCILCLKGYYEWKQAGGIGVWRYGGTVKITAFPKGSLPSLIGSESADDSLDGSDSSQYEQLLEFLHLSNEVTIEESKTANALAFLFDRFGLWLLQAYLRDSNGIEEFPLNAMLVDTLISKIVKDFSTLLVYQGTQLGLFLKKLLKADMNSLSKSNFIEAISLYLGQKTSLASNDVSKFCICGGKRDIVRRSVSHSAVNADLLDLQQREIQDIKLDFQQTKLEVKQIHSNWEEELKRLVHHIKGLEVASSSYHKVLEENRMLYNQVQDLKGTIRVYCRVRPFLQGQTNGQSTVDYIGENGNIMIVNPLKQGKDARKVFSFNKVFGPTISQGLSSYIHIVMALFSEQIYVDTQPLVRSVLDGFNVCIFAYGQTGSGKTYTMSGPDLTTEQTWGVNYRALNDLFQISKERADFVKYEVVELYNFIESGIRFTLTTHTLDIRNNSQLNGLNVPDASWVPVSSTQDVLELMRTGQKNRAVGATALNERSSRSHSVLTIHVYGKELVSGSILKGCLHLVDLAGSERVDKSEAVGDRLKEAQHINKSLSALGDVISALAQKSAHIPYRNSKLTQISNLKLALEKKEAEVEQLKGGNARSATESQRARAVSPFHIPRRKPESSPRRGDDNRITEARSCSSGKQRRSRFPSVFADKETFPKMPILAEERLPSVVNARSPSPPVRRSLSTDRGALIRSRIKADTVDNQPVSKVPFPARVPVNKSLASTTVTPSADSNSSRVHVSSQEISKQDSISDKLSTKKLHPEHEEEQFRQALNVRQGGIRKSKAESKAKMKHQLPTRLHKTDAAVTLLSEIDTGEKIEEPRKSDFSETENENTLIGSLTSSALKTKRFRQNITRNSQNVEPRGSVQAVEPFLGEKNRQEKDGSKTLMPEFRRSRSSPRGKFLVLP
ncbi:hypothetical protein GOBAR_AA34909 [Gossypium barbadense]|uniref:Kinesin motor domain-containing protein n=1 Tax=Gossypium barbadense TaxID=3634 RepID=A0A2P5W405_GOSBA|nr:hypothetical protein GOBAR_AA34909 [Gossypium barbadense]